MVRFPPPRQVPPPLAPRRWAPTGIDPDAEIEPRVSNEDMVVHKIEVRDEAGNPVTLWASEVATVTSENSNPPGATFEEVIIDAGNYRTQMFDGQDRTPGLLTPTFGNATYLNAGGRFDPWAGYITDGGMITAFIGPYGGEFPAEFRKVFIAYIEGDATFPGQAMQLDFRGREKLLQKDLVTAGFDGTLGSENGVAFERDGVPGSRRQQIVMGQPPHFKPILLNDLENVWFLCANALDPTFEDGLPRLFDGGTELTYSGGIGSGQGGGSFRMPYSPAHPNGPVLVQPVSQVRVELRAEMAGLYSPGDITPRPWTICDALRQAGVSIDPSDPDAFAPGSTNFGCGSRLVETQTVAQVLQDVAVYQVAAIGFDRLDRFFARPIVPSFAGTSGYTFIDSGSYPEGSGSKWQWAKVPGHQKRVHKVRVRSGATTRSALTGIVEDGIRDALARDPWMRTFTAEVLYNSGPPFYSRRRITDVDPTAVVAEVEIQSHDILTTEDMEAYALRYLPLHASKQSGVTLTEPFSIEKMGLPIGQQVTLQTTRFGGSREAIIWMIDAKLKRPREITFGCCSHVETGGAIENDAPTASEIYIVEEDSAEGAGGGGAGGSGVAGRGDAAIQLEHDYVNMADKTSAIAVGYSDQDFIVPYPGTIAKLIGQATTPQASGSVLTMDVEVNGVSILSTLITVPNSAYHSLGATQCVIAAPSVLAGDRVRFRVTQCGTGGKGPAVNILWYQT